MYPGDRESDECCPKQAPWVWVGPEELVEGQPVHFLKNRRSRSLHRFGRREYILFQMMDGNRTVGQLAIEYVTTTRTRASARSIEKFVRYLQDRDLLDFGTTSDKSLLTNHGQPVSAPGSMIILLRPTKQLEWLSRCGGLWFDNRFVVGGIAAILITELWIGRNFESIAYGVVHGSARQVGLTALCAAGIYYLETIVHEFAHALTYKRYTGDVPQLGVTSRYIIPTLCTKLDDLLLIDDRRHRIAILLAGVFSNLLILPPVALLWWATHNVALLHRLSGGILVWYNFAVLTSVLPFIELDGYFVLTTVLRMPYLRSEAYRYYLRKRNVVRGPAERAPQYSGINALKMTIYGATVVLMAAGGLAILARYTIKALVSHLGRP